MPTFRATEGDDFIVQWVSRAYGASGSQLTALKISGIDGSFTVNTLAVTGALTASSTVAAHGTITMSAGANIAAATTGAGTEIGTGATQLLGFWGATAVAQPSTTGTATGFTTGTGTAVHDDSTFTAGVGTKAYRISDIVLALKTIGILASS